MRSGRQYCGLDAVERSPLTPERGTLSVRVLLLLLPPIELGSRNQWNSGRRLTRLPAVIPRPASTLDQIEMLAVASVGLSGVSWGWLLLC